MSLLVFVLVLGGFFWRRRGGGVVLHFGFLNFVF